MINSLLEAKMNRLMEAMMNRLMEAVKNGGTCLINNKYVTVV